ncbi:hypothetical protein [Cetobacterium sp.]|uniref:hypothetical protein n=1 Tax=Cetobacterium sp. TaxID=2071632 RepID=UPI0025BA4FB6|nr:hypothetical protein [Cetobacterium sp.]
MKKILLSLAILTIFAACGKEKEEVATQEVIVEQTTVIEKVPTNSTIEAIEQSVAADVIEETNGDVIIPNSEIVSTEEIVETVAN